MYLYLAGPITSRPDTYEAEFVQAAQRLRDKGHIVVNPVELDDPTEVDTYFAEGAPEDKWADFMRRDIACLVECDAVVVLPGWKDSKGARLEVGLARSLGMPVLRVYDLQPIHDEWAVNDLGAKDEVRVTDPVTGGQKGKKLAMLGAVDPLALTRIAEVAGFGASKYERSNFAKGYAWSLSFDAMQRHLLAFWGGEYEDAESGLPHLAHAAWHCCTLMTFVERMRGTDDRLPVELERDAYPLKVVEDDSRSWWQRTSRANV